MARIRLASTLLTLSLTALLAAPQASFAKDKKTSPPRSEAQAVSTLDSTELTAYLKIQDALASDDLDGAKTAAKSLASESKRAQVSASAGQLAEAKDIAAARESFKSLSRPFVQWTSKNRPKGVAVYYCPMVKSKWVQKKGSIRNPYYGKAMLECGEKSS